MLANEEVLLVRGQGDVSYKFNEVRKREKVDFGTGYIPDCNLVA